jgi:hypothetical protein
MGGSVVVSALSVLCVYPSGVYCMVCSAYRSYVLRYVHSYVSCCVLRCCLLVERPTKVGSLSLEPATTGFYCTNTYVVIIITHRLIDYSTARSALTSPANIGITQY